MERDPKGIKRDIGRAWGDTRGGISQVHKRVAHRRHRDIRSGKKRHPEGKSGKKRHPEEWRDF